LVNASSFFLELKIVIEKKDCNSANFDFGEKLCNSSDKHFFQCRAVRTAVPCQDTGNFFVK
jgi:hypothetical protein